MNKEKLAKEAAEDYADKVQDFKERPFTTHVDAFLAGFKYANTSAQDREKEAVEIINAFKIILDASPCDYSTKMLAKINSFLNNAPLEGKKEVPLSEFPIKEKLIIEAPTQEAWDKITEYFKLKWEKDEQWNDLRKDCCIRIIEQNKAACATKMFYGVPEWTDNSFLTYPEFLSLIKSEKEVQGIDIDKLRSDFKARFSPNEPLHFNMANLEIIFEWLEQRLSLISTKEKE